MFGNHRIAGQCPKLRRVSREQSCKKHNQPQSRIILITRLVVHPLTFDSPAQMSRVRSANESERMWLSVLRMRVIAVTAKRVFLKLYCSKVPTMLDASVIEVGFSQIAPERLRTALANFLPQHATRAERIRAIEAGLRSPVGQSVRDAMAKWIVDVIVPVDRLVPEAYVKWREPVRDAMMFVVARLSPARLAPKLLEQLELPDNTSAETRLLRLIAKVPGLQKLGQVIARNQHLRPALRNALARLENGIRDVQPEEIRAIIEQDLGPLLRTFAFTSRRPYSQRPVSARWCASPGAILPVDGVNAAFSRF